MPTTPTTQSPVPPIPRFAAALLAIAALAAAGASQAALVDRGGGLIYDTVLDITWLADMDHAKTQYDNSGGALGDADGQMEWLDANLWANDLVYGGYTDWRLPNVLQPDLSCSHNHDPGDGSGVQSGGYGCVGSEMGHLFYLDLGGKAGESLLEATGDTALEIANLALFSNVQSDIYWSSRIYAPASFAAWSFFTADGRQTALNKDFQLHAMAVRRGDSIGTLPEPSAAGLVTLALGLMAGLAGARSKSSARVAGGRLGPGANADHTSPGCAALALPEPATHTSPTCGSTWR